MDDKPRFSRITDLVDLIIFMSSKLNGVTLKDIQERFNVSRRTAERMRDAVMLALPQVDELPSDDKYKRWGFDSYSLSELVFFTPEELAFLEKLKTHCDKISAKDLDEIITKLKALNNRKLTNIEDKTELLLKSEGFAVSQAPSYKIDFAIVSDIRMAIKEKRKLAFVYNDKPRTLIPLGLIYGEKVFLLAKKDDKEDNENNEYVLNLHFNENVPMYEYKKKFFYGCCQYKRSFKLNTSFEDNDLIELLAFLRFLIYNGDKNELDQLTGINDFSLAGNHSYINNNFNYYLLYKINNVEKVNSIKINM